LIYPALKAFTSGDFVTIGRGAGLRRQPGDPSIRVGNISFALYVFVELKKIPSHLGTALRSGR